MYSLLWFYGKGKKIMKYHKGIKPINMRLDLYQTKGGCAMKHTLLDYSMQQALTVFRSSSCPIY